MRKTFLGVVGGMLAGASGALAQGAPVALVVAMPEASSVALLAIDLFAVGGLIFVWRRRSSRTKSR